MTSSLTVDQLKDSLSNLGLQTTGKKDQLKSRLKKATKKLKQDSDKLHSFFNHDDNEQDQVLPRLYGQESGNRSTTDPVNHTQIARSYGNKKEQDSPSKDGPKKKVWKPKFHTFLITDVEATCEKSKLNFKGKKVSSFEYPNEIIEFPLIVLRYNPELSGASSSNSQDGSQSSKGKEKERSNQDASTSTSSLEKVATFHSYVRPTWRPRLSEFCKGFTGIQQSTVDSAPAWQEVHSSVKQFLQSLDLLEEVQSSNSSSTTSPNLQEHFKDLILKPGVTWVTHGLCDLQDFIVKQSFISHSSSLVTHYRHSIDKDGKRTTEILQNPHFRRKPEKWIQTPILDLRRTVFALVHHSTSAERREQDEADLKMELEELNSLSAAWDEMTLRSNEPPKNGLEDISTPTDLLTSKKKKGKRKKGLGFTSANGTIEGLLKLLDLKAFEGRQHSGMDDCLNIERIFREVFDRIERKGQDLEEKIRNEKVAYWEWRREIEKEMKTNTNEEEKSNDHQRRPDLRSSSSEEDLDEPRNRFKVKMEEDHIKWQKLREQFDVLKGSKSELELIERESLYPVVNFRVRNGEEEIKVKKWYWMGSHGEIEWYRRQDLD